MTQAPATPELVERLRDPDFKGSFQHLRPWTEIDALFEEAADALEAQQARIAELEAVLTLARDFAETEVEMRGAAGSDMSDYQNEAQEVVDAIDQALSSQGRHEGGEDGLPELPGVNAVPLPASPDGPSQMDRVWAAVNVLGAPDTACTSDEDRAYCRAIGDALSEIEKLGGRPQ